MARESVKIIGLEGVLKTLKELPPELVSKNGGPVRAALRKGGNVILKQAQANVQTIIDTPNIDGQFVSTGLAKKSIRIKRIRPLNNAKGEAFIVSVRPSKYAGKRINRKGRNEADLQANDVLFMLEAGTERRPAMPWMRPAFEAKKSEAITIFNRELPKAIDRIVKKLARKNKAS